MNEAAVLKLANGRFFTSFNKKGAVCSAWCLAGGTLFMNGDWRLNRVELKLRVKGKKFERLIVCLRDEVKS